MIDAVFDGGATALPSRSGPWPKSCDRCAFLPGDPQGIGEDAVADTRSLVACGQMTFYCLHRTTAAGRHRECACAAAIAGKGDAS